MKTIHIILLWLLIIPAIPLHAQDNRMLSNAEKKAVATTISATYSPWHEVEISGKLHLDRLPISPSVKIYMKADQSVLISLRAPFIGEAGRIEIEGDSVTAVNRMKKVYAKESIAELTRFFPVGLSDLQALLLGRVAIGSTGQLSANNVKLTDIYADGDTDWLVVPVPQVQPEAMNYGYLVDQAGKLLAFMGVGSDSDNTATMLYSYQKSDMQIDLDLNMGEKNIVAELDLDKPKTNAKPLERFKPSSKFKRTDIRGFLKSF